MRGQRDNSSKLFLTELMISIFFFSVITAFCVQLFSEAHSLSVRSEKLTHAVEIAANVAEYYNGWDFDNESWQKVFPQGSWKQDTWKMNLDENWEPCKEDGKYILEMHLRENGNLLEAHIMVKGEQADVLYTLMTSRIHEVE